MVELGFCFGLIKIHKVRVVDRLNQCVVRLSNLFLERYCISRELRGTTVSKVKGTKIFKTFFNFSTLRFG